MSSMSVGNLRTGALLLLPLFVWFISASALLVLVASKQGSQRPDSAACKVEEISTPQGLGTLSRPKDKGAWRLSASRETGNGLMIFRLSKSDSIQCGSFLRLTGFRQAPGYDIKLFARTRDGALEERNLPDPYLKTAVFDVADLVGPDMGSVTEWGLAFSPSHSNVFRESRPVGYLEIEGVALVPHSILIAMQAWITEWLAFHPWSGRSINVVDQPPEDGIAWQRPNFLFGISLLPAILISLLVIRRDRARLLIAVSLPIAFAWLLLDMSWQRNLLSQNHETGLHYPAQHPPGVLAHAADQRLADISQWVETHARDSDARIFIVAPEMFERERLYYHLLPRRAAWIYPNWTNLPTRVDPQRIRGDYLVLLSGTKMIYETEQRPQLKAGSRSLPVRLVAEYDDVQLFEIHPRPEGR